MEKTYTITLTEEQVVRAFGSAAVSSLPPKVMTDEIREVVENARAYDRLVCIGEYCAREPDLVTALLGKGKAAVLEVRYKGSTEREESS